MTSLRMLGPTSITIGSSNRSPASARIRTAVAALGLHAGKHVSIQDLTAWIWGDEQRQADNPAAAIHTYMSRLRRLLSGETGSEAIRLETVPAGYVLAIAGESVDAIKFERSVTASRTLIAAGSLDQAAAELATAMKLWSGEPLMDVTRTPPAVAAASRLSELRLVAIETLSEVQLRRGMAAAMLGELAAVTAEHPLREGLARQYMLALYQCGDRPGALAVYRDIYQRLRDDLGTEPCQALRELYTEVLREGPVPGSRRPPVAAKHGRPLPETDEPRGPAAPAESANAATAPAGSCVLPAIPAALLPRNAEMAQLDKATATSLPGLPQLAVITGPPGVGKTTVAVQYALRRRADFPDGVYFVPLSGAGTPGPAADDVLCQILAELGVSAIPEDPSARLASYHHILGRRKVLVILDGAVSADQVCPLLTGADACFLVTSVRQLHDLADDRQVAQVQRLSAADGAWLLGRLTSRPIQVTAADAATLVRLCEGLPLAIRIIAAHIATGCYESVDAAIAALRDPDHRVRELAYGGLSVAESYARGLLACGPAEKAALQQLVRQATDVMTARELEILLGPALAGSPARPLQALRGLVQANLLDPRGHSPSGQARFAVTPLCRAAVRSLSGAGELRLPGPQDLRGQRGTSPEHSRPAAAPRVSGAGGGGRHRLAAGRAGRVCTAFSANIEAL